MGFATSTIGDISSDNADDSRSSIGSAGVKDRATAYAVNGNSVDKISGRIPNMGTNVAGEKTESIGFDSGEPDPSDFDSNFKNRPTWQEWYEILWKFKLSRIKQKQRGVSRVIF